MGDAEVEHGLARPAHPELGARQLARGELHGVAARLAGQRIDQLAHDHHDLRRQPLRVLGAERLHLHGDGVLGGIVEDVDALLPIFDELFARDLGVEAVEEVGRRVGIDGPERQPLLQLRHHLAALHVVGDDVGIRHHGGRRHAGDHAERVGHLRLVGAHREARLRDEAVGGDGEIVEGGNEKVGSRMPAAAETSEPRPLLAAALARLLLQAAHDVDDLGLLLGERRRLGRLGRRPARPRRRRRHRRRLGGSGRHRRRGRRGRSARARRLGARRRCPRLRLPRCVLAHAPLASARAQATERPSYSNVPRLRVSA